MYKDLQSYIRDLEIRGELKRIKEPVSHELEITEVANKIVKMGGPALLFENVIGKEFPLVIGLFGTRERMARALGVTNLNDISLRIKKLMDVKLGGGLMGLAANLPKLKELKALAPKRIRNAPVQEVVWQGNEVDLNKIPILKCWPKDGGDFITLPLVFTQDPKTGEKNIGMYRMQVFDKNTTAMHWQRFKTGRKHLQSAKELGRKLEVAVALGGDPALTYAATAPIPPVPGINELSLTGFLRGKPLEVVKGITVDLEVPAHAEFILEGYVDPNEDLVIEGPFGDHTGFYNLEDHYPVFHVTAITMRKNAIYPATIVGRPPMEDAYLIEATERIFLPLAQMIIPEIIDYHLPPAGIAHNLVNVLIKKDYPGQAYKVANGMLGLGQMMTAKVILVASGDIKPQQHLQFWRDVLKNAVPGKDSQFAKGPIDDLDHSSRAFTYGSKLIIDGTVKTTEENNIEWTANKHKAKDSLPEHDEIIDQHQFAGGFWFITIKKTYANQGKTIAQWAGQQKDIEGVRLVAVLDEETNPRNFEDAIWTMLNNIDPERDIEIASSEFGNVFLVDASQKIPAEGFDRPWPEKLKMNQDVVEKMQALVEQLEIKI